MKIYSPTQTELFLKCPMLWWLKQQGWESAIRLWTPHQLIGSAIHAGLFQHYEGDATIQCEAAGLEVLSKGWQEQDQWSRAQAETNVRQGIMLGINSSQLIGHSVVNAEFEIAGRRVDVILRGTEGLIVDEIKTALSLDSWFIPQRLAEYEHSWQLRDYAYHVGQHFHEPVVVARILLIVLAPQRQACVYPIPQSEAALASWYEEACQVWSLMAEYQTPVAQPPWKNLTSCSDWHQHFGRRCEMYEGCHELGGDESKFEIYYSKKRTIEHKKESGEHAV